MPATQVLLTRAAEQGRPIGPTVGVLLRLLNRFGTEELQAAVLQALDQDAPHPSAVRLALDLRREQQRRLPPVALILPAHVQAKDATVRTAQLDAYDRLKDAADDQP